MLDKLMRSSSLIKLQTLSEHVLVLVLGFKH